MQETVLSALRAGDFAAAETAARDWLAKDPRDADAEHLLGTSLQAQGQLDAADAAFARAIAIEPDRTDTHIARALLATQRRDTAAATAGFEQAMAQDPNKLIVYLSLAQLALGRGDVEEADRQLRVAERINPDHPHLLAQRGQVLLARGEGEQALSLLTRAAREAPDDGLLQGVLGLVLLGLDRHAFAEQALRNALARQPNATALRHALLRTLLAQNRFDEANDEVGVLLRETPGDAAALALQGQLARQRGELAQARAAFERSLQSRPRQGVLRALLEVSRQVGTPRDLAATLEALVAQHPTFDPAWMALLDLARGDGAYSATIADRWYAISPTPPVSELVAQVCEAQGDLARAATLAQNVLEHAPTRPAAHLVLARAELRDGNAAAAVARLQPLLAQTQQAQQRAALLGWYGHALDRTGDHAGAAAAWREGLRLLPPMPPLPAPALDPDALRGALDNAAANAAPVADGEPGPILLWGPPGAFSELAAALVHGADGLQLVGDRFGATPRVDGFTRPDRIEQFAGSPDAAAAAFVGAWRAGLAALGHPAGASVDWLPHLDARALPMLRAAAPGTRIVAVLRDPRDLLLNWLVFGSPQSYGLGDPVTAAAQLANALEPLAVLRAQASLPLLELRDGLADGDLASAGTALAAFLGLHAAPDTAAALRVRNGTLGLPTAFPDGHWRHYATALADAFAPLHAVAERLGYPAA